MLLELYQKGTYATSPYQRTDEPRHTFHKPEHMLPNQRSIIKYSTKCPQE